MKYPPMDFRKYTKPLLKVALPNYLIVKITQLKKGVSLSRIGF